MLCTDEELAEKWKSGDMSAFEAIFRRYERRIFCVACRMIGSAEDADDLTQDTFLRANKSICGYRGGKFSTWLFRIAANICIDHARRRKTRQTTSLDELIETEDWTDGGSGEYDPQEILMRDEFSQSVRSVLESVAPQYRILLVLKHIDGMPYEEIASVVGCSVNALGVRLHRAREAFRRKMAPLMESTYDEVQRSEKKNIPTV